MSADRTTGGPPASLQRAPGVMPQGGRPVASDPWKAFTVRIRASQRSRLRALAYRKSLRIGQVVRTALEEHLDREEAKWRRR